MEMTITIDNLERSLEVTPDGDGYIVSIGEASYRVSDVNSIEGTISFLLDRHSYMAHVSDGEGGVRISIRGRNYRLIEESMDADRPGGPAVGGDGRVEAPMPGTIVAVRVAEGDTVSAGQPLLVLESMKMQNEITAPVDGVVKHLGCSQGEQVGFGAILAEIEPAGDE
jgi:acetyl-CoA/propionyl-CoA carboxylase biotin carboxyl carrier protein